MNDPLLVQETVGRPYAELAVLAPTQTVSCCSDSDNACFGPTGYQGMDLSELPEAGANASLGCGNPIAVASLAGGETVLDLDSGGRHRCDPFRPARPEGKVYGLNMTHEILDLARRNAAEAGVANVEFLKGHIEQIRYPTIRWTL